MSVTFDEMRDIIVTQDRRKSVAVAAGLSTGLIVSAALITTDVMADYLLIPVCVALAGLFNRARRRWWCRHAWINLNHDKVRCQFCKDVKSLHQIDPGQICYHKWPN